MQKKLYDMFVPASDCSLMQKQLFLAEVFKIDSTTTHLFMFFSFVFGALLLVQPPFSHTTSGKYLMSVYGFGNYMRCICYGNMLHARHALKLQHRVTHMITHTHTYLRSSPYSSML